MASISMAEKAIHAERELQSLKTKYQLLQEFSENLKKQLDDTNNTLQKSRDDYYESIQGKESLKYDFDMMKEENERLKKDKNDLVEMIKEKNNDNIHLKETIQTLKATTPACDQPQTQVLNEIKLKEIKLKFEESRLNQEKALYTNQIELLNEQLKHKNSEFLNFRKQNDEVVLQAQLKNDKYSQEINGLKLEVDRLKKLNDSKETLNEDLSKKYLDLQVNCNKLQSSYQRECETNQDVIQLLTKRTEELQVEIDSRDKDIEELRSIVQKGCDAHQELENEFMRMKNSYIEDIKNLEMERSKLSNELEISKHTVANVNNQNIEKMFETFFPLAMETNKNLTNKINLSELYSDYVTVKQDLQSTLEINEELKVQISELYEKIDETRPVIYKNLQDYDHIMNENEVLHQNLKEIVDQNDSILREKDEFIRTINSLERQIGRYNEENSRLSLQIAYLLKSVQEANGFIVSPESQLSSDSDSICFKDIIELQERNRTLLALLHQLQNESDQVASGIELDDLKQKLDNLSEENEKLKSMLEHKGDRSGTFKNLSSSFNRSFDESFLDFVAENKELKIKLDKYSQDIEEIRQKHFEDTRKLENDKNELISTNAILNGDIVRLSAELEAKKRLEEDINSQLEKYQNENTTLRERNIKLNSDVENLEKNVLTLKSQINSLNENLKLNENNVTMAYSERDLFRNNYNNLLTENARLQEEVNNQRKKLYSLQAIQDSFSRTESTTISNLTSQVDSLRKENMFYQQKIEKQEDRLKKSMEEFGERFHSLQVMLEKERSNYLQLQREHFELRLNTQHQSNVDITKADPQPSEPISINEQNNLKKQLQMAQDEIKILKGKLSNSESASENLKTINQSLEENLNQLMANNENIKDKLENESKNKIDQVNNLLGDLNNLRVQYDKMVQEKNAEVETLRNTADNNAKRIEELQKLLKDADEAAEKARQNESQLLDDLTIQTTLAAKAQEDYQAEVELRSTDAHKIFQLNLTIEDLNKQSVEKEIENFKSKEQFTTTVETLRREKNCFEEECAKLQSRCKLLEQSNESLLTELEQVNNRIIALQSNSNLFVLDENNQKESADRLATVIKFLRQEKFQLQSKCSKLVDSERCLQVEIENYRKQIENLKKSLEVEKQSSNRLHSMSEFNDMVAKAELVPILTEDNTQIRSQLARLEKRNTQLQEELEKFKQKEKSLLDMSNKVETEAVSNESLKNELELLRSKYSELRKQLAKGSDSESVKRLTAEKDNISRQALSSLNDFNKVKSELEGKIKAFNQVNLELNEVKQKLASSVEESAKAKQELTDTANKNQTLQSTITQLKALARKYRDESVKFKSSANETFDKECQCDIREQPTKMLDVESKLREKLEQNNELMNNFKKISEENEVFKKQAIEKDEKAKKIAQQAKQRISDLKVATESLTLEKGQLTKENNELKSRISQLEGSVEQNSLTIAMLKSQYETKLNSQTKELQAANKQIGDLTSKLQQQPPSSTSVTSQSSTVPLTTTVIPVGIATNITSSTAPTRHSVHPQSVSTSASSIQAAKTTPTASIKPLTVAATRPPPTRPTQVLAMIQPTATEESLNPPAVPQATVQPTSLSTPSSTSISSTIPEFSGAYSAGFDISQPSTSSQPPQGFDKKRPFESTLDEPSSSMTTKKMKNDVELITLANEDEESDVEFDVDAKVESDVVNTNAEDSISPAFRRGEQSDENQIGSAPESGLDDDREEADDELNNEEEDFDEDVDEEKPGAYDEEEDIDEEPEEFDDDIQEESDLECMDENEGEELDEEDEEEDEGEDEEEEDNQIRDSSEIEVIAIDDSDEEHEAEHGDPGPSSATRDEVSSSNVQSSSQKDEMVSQTNNDQITTTDSSDQTGRANVSQNIFGSSFQFGNTSAPQSNSEPSQSTVASRSIEETATSSTTVPATTNRTQRRQPVIWTPARTVPQPGGQLPESGEERPNVRRLNVRGVNRQRRPNNRTRRFPRY